MNRNKYSSIAHRDHVFSNPISSSKINKMINLIPLRPESKVIDIGAGTCELPIRLIDKYSVSATAIEIYEGSIEEGKKRASGRIPMENIDFINENAKSVVENYSNNNFDLGICEIGRASCRERW